MHKGERRKASENKTDTNNTVNNGRQDGSMLHAMHTKIRRHEKHNENRTGKENQQEVTPIECLCPPPHT